MGSFQIAEKISETLGPLIEIFYPRICLVCSARDAKSAPLICSNCWKNLLRQIQLNHEEARTRKPSVLSGADFLSGGVYPTGALPIISLAGFVDPLAEMIRLFKFHGYTRLGQRLGRLLAQRTASKIRSMSPDRLIGTPLHFSDFRRRGFNQAEILSDILSGACGLTPARNLIAKAVRTKHQSRLDAEKRAYNLAGAFEAQAPELKGARVVLVDDVITTGATIREIGRTLSEAGAKVVGAVALASKLPAFALDENEEYDDTGNEDSSDF